MVTPTREELERFLRSEKDQSDYRLSEFDFTRKLIEGIFRAHTLETVGDSNWIADFGPSSSPSDLESRLEDSTPWRNRLLELGEALARGLESSNLSRIREVAGQVVRLSRELPEEMDSRVREFENKTELVDGTGRYAATRVMMEASRGEIEGMSEVDFPDSGQLKSDLIEELSQPLDDSRETRDALAAIGAGKGMILDRLFPGWKKVLFDDKASLDELLKRTLGVPEQLTGFPITEVEVAGRELTVALAEDNRRRQQGLMYVTDLKSLDGMVFYFPREVEGGFWMKNTKIPLQIGYFRSTGDLARSMLMKPCRSADCPTYSPGKPYQYALELPMDSRLTLREHPDASIVLSYHPGD